MLDHDWRVGYDCGFSEGVKEGRRRHYSALAQERAKREECERLLEGAHAILIGMQPLPCDTTCDKCDLGKPREGYPSDDPVCDRGQLVLAIAAYRAAQQSTQKEGES